MKTTIHPDWHSDCVVTCSCGNTFTTGSVEDHLKVDICNKCHPFFTGEMRFVDEQGRVEKFQQKQQRAAKWQETKKAKAKDKAKKSEAPKTLKEMLSGAAKITETKE